MYSKGESKMGLTGVTERIQKLTQQLYTAKGQIESLEKQKGKVEASIEESEKQQEHLLTMKTLLETATEEARESGKRVLAETSTHAVQMALDDDKEVDVTLSQKRGVANADLIIRQEIDGLLLETDPTNDEGGGTADIVSLSTFISMGMLAGEDNLSPYFLDEPTKYVSKGNSDNVAKFLKEIVEYAERQTILVTHDEVVAEAGDKKFKVERDETGTSNVTEI